MDGLKAYLMSVFSAALLCAILKQIVGKEKPSGGTIHLLSGLFVAVCIISPWKNFSLQDLERYNPLQIESGDMYVETGSEMTQARINAIIIEQTEAYIMEKANQMQVQVEVKVEVSDEGIPVRAVISGDLSQIDREALSAFLVKEIGIQREMQIWR